MKRVAILIIKFYQRFISPFIGQHCRYHPTCSEYCIQALAKYGIVRGCWLSTKRILRCNPFVKGGYDPLE